MVAADSLLWHTGYERRIIIITTYMGYRPRIMTSIPVNYVGYSTCNVLSVSVCHILEMGHSAPTYNVDEDVLICWQLLVSIL